MHRYRFIYEISKIKSVANKQKSKILLIHPDATFENDNEIVRSLTRYNLLLGEMKFRLKKANDKKQYLKKKSYKVF